ncbi:hypothetical protein COCMIDRAFT_28289 [Bipolaris oryzae ATCC 44560]|uniref:F-box domain-containing protein n=1 Tax=Bipolaris oryzae ATCC 44560 TaxID=930090 RepID=W6Z6Q6_COCMI|nr:uncharacterized protein COCMIDRAFT_28289 [Bipolaris oryzae ATCC 44560]EUC43214.1 hypothetical protein COCMIDRAFT_28289 [Bipolaris oryzae ATCC 44560]
MAASPTITDPLAALPPEIVLRILDFTPISTLGSLTCVSRAWQQFIDHTHQDAIYSSPSKTVQPPKRLKSQSSARDFSFLESSTSFSKFFDNVTSWKDLCKRQTLLGRNWNAPRPVTRESVLQVGNDAIWRFKVDFKRRLFISTSHAGGLNVTDMDSGRLLWRLPSVIDTTEEHAVRPYAHLEYQDGTAVFDREGDALEVWRTDEEGTERGVFKRIAVLDHDCQTRGFQLSYWTLVVVAVEGQGFVYDMTQTPPKLTTHLTIEQDAVGHLDQNEDMVVYSMGTRGYHVYNKESGDCLGQLQPLHCTDKYYLHPLPPVNDPSFRESMYGLRHGQTRRIFPPASPRRNRLTPIELGKGPLPNAPDDPNHPRNGEDEWGAGMLDRDSNLFVGFSRFGRVFICSDIRKALENGPKSTASHSQILECDSDGSDFDLGGWLSVRNHRIMFGIQNRIYVVALNAENRLDFEDDKNRNRPSYSLLTGSTPQLMVPVSFMALYDDSIMTTYATIGQRQEEDGPGRIFPTKAIRILSLAPSLDNNDHTTTDSEVQAQRPRNTLMELWMMFNDEPSDGEDTWRSIDGHELDNEWEDEEDE